MKLITLTFGLCILLANVSASVPFPMQKVDLAQRQSRRVDLDRCQYKLEGDCKSAGCMWDFEWNDAIHASLRQPIPGTGHCVGYVCKNHTTMFSCTDGSCKWDSGKCVEARLVDLSQRKARIAGLRRALLVELSQLNQEKGIVANP